MRLLGLDYGSKTVGVAVTDPLGYTAQPLETITRKEENKLRRTLARIEQLVGEYQIEKIVLGYPVNMDGSAGERAELALAFKAMLERRTKLEVIMQDERLTTVAADEILQECGMPREKRKTVIDQVAAGLILQDFMENTKKGSKLADSESDTRLGKRKDWRRRMEDKIILTADDGTDVTFYVIEETRLGASNYLLVADSDDEDAECLILKDTSRDEDPEAVYELVEDETELDAVSKVFEELLSDEDITIE